VLAGPYREQALGQPSQSKYDLNVGLSPDTPKEEVERIVKAFKHIATLSGAKLPNDDLFK
jgi:hypothetical protein